MRTLLLLLCLSVFLGPAVCRVVAAQDQTEPGQTDPGVDRGQKSFGLHTSLDGTSLLWANTSAVTTAGFFGNAAVLLAGVYLLTHTEEVTAFADRLLPVGQAKVQTVQEDELDVNQNIFEKGQELIGDSFTKFNDNLSKRKGGLFQLPSLENLLPTNPENPLMMLKEKLFPGEAEDKVAVIQSTQAPQRNLGANAFADNFAEKLAMQSWNYMSENEDLGGQLPDQSWSHVNTNTEFEDESSLPFLFDYDASYYDSNPSLQQRAANSGQDIAIEKLLPEMKQKMTPPVTQQVSQELKETLSEGKLKLAEHKKKMQEKKKKWAEAFLANFYKKQELDELRKKEEQGQIVVSTTPSNGYFTEPEYHYQEPEVEDFDNFDDEGFNDPNGFYEEGFRIGNEVQAIIDAQLSDFESFGVRIPKTAEELEKEAQQQNINDALDVEETTKVDEDIEITTLSFDKQEVVTDDEEENTTQTQYYVEDISEDEASSEIVSSSGDDVVLSEEIADGKKSNEHSKKLKKVKKMKKTKE